MIDMGAKVTPEMIEGCSNDEIRIVLEKALAQQGTSLNNEDKKNERSVEEKKETAAAFKTDEATTRIKHDGLGQSDTSSQRRFEERVDKRDNDKSKTATVRLKQNEGHGLE